MIDGPTWPSILPPSYLDPEDLPDSLIEEATAVILEEGKAVIYEYKVSFLLRFVPSWTAY